MITLKPFVSLILFSLFFIFNNSSYSQTDSHFYGKYISNAEPNDSALIFAEELVSGEFNVRDAALSPDGKEFFFSLKGPSFFSIVYTSKINGTWQKPEVASFSGKYADIEPCFSLDGSKLYFVSNRPLDGIGEPKDYDIWYVEKDKNKWSEPINIGLPINTEANEFYPSFTNDGTMYFCAKYENSIGGEDLYFSELKDGKYQSPVNMGDSVNSVKDEFNSFVSPDGKFIMYTSMGWGSGVGSGDLWISFRKDDKTWRKPINMGPKVNSTFFEYCPSLTPDGKYLYFTSNRSKTEKYSEERLSYNKIIDGLRSTLNGSQNIYWISSEFIQKLNK